MPTPARLSARLSRSLVLWVCALWLMTALGTTWYVRTEVNDVYDSALSESAWRLLDLVSHEMDEHGASPVLGEAPPPRSGSFPLHLAPHHLIYQITSPDGRLLLRSADAPTEVLAPEVRYGFSEQGAWRVFSLTHPTPPARPASMWPTRCSTASTPRSTSCCRCCCPCWACCPFWPC